MIINSRKFFLLIVVIISSVVFNVCVFAEDTAQDLQNKINERANLIKKLEEEIKLYADLADKTSKEAKTLSNYIKSLDNQVKSITTDIKKSQISIDKTNLEIKKISNEIVGKEEKVKRLNSGVRESLYNQYILDNTSLVENFLSNKNILASIQEIGYLQIIQDNIRNNIKEVLQIKKVLEKDKNEEQDKKIDLEKQKEQLKIKQNSLNIVKNEQKKELEITKNQESNYKKILADRKKQKDAFEKELFEYENKLKYTLNPNSIPKAGTSPLSWPIDPVRITQKFGITSASKRLYKSGTHSGVDFGAPVGTPLLAMASGILVAQGDTDLVCKGVSFGGWVLIKFDNGLAATYGHLSKHAIQVGSRVNTGDIVGYSGNTGYSTGPHLHLSVYPSDAVNALSRASLSCPGKDLYMPIAPVDAYLDPLAYMPK